MELDHNIPNLIIIGVIKGGTTSLYAYLRKHTEVCASTVKETCYFLPSFYTGESLESLDTYKSFFHPEGSEKIIMEATPGYFYGGKRLTDAIINNIGYPKLLLVLREPIERTFSFYNYAKSNLLIEDAMSFQTYLNKCVSLKNTDFDYRTNFPFTALYGSDYSIHLDAWQPFFERNLIKVIDFDEIKNNPKSLMIKISKWLNIDSMIYEDMEFTIENQTVPYKSQRLQKIALKVNTQLEVLFRKMPSIKQFFRNIYYKINGKPIKLKIEISTYDFLEKYFETENKVLFQKLSEHKVTIPKWLKEKEKP